MKLYGSTTSPFVRRIRLLLADNDYTFVNMDIFAGPGRELLRTKNPTLKVPVLEDDDLMIYDSRVIFRYLAEKSASAPITWAQENQLTLIDAANDSLVQLMMLKRSDIASDPTRLIFKLHQERVDNVLATLNRDVEQGSYNVWHYPAMCLYCLIDWTLFRELISFAPYPALTAFWQVNQGQPSVAQTDPRN